MPLLADIQTRGSAVTFSGFLDQMAHQAATKVSRINTANGGWFATTTFQGEHPFYRFWRGDVRITTFGAVILNFNVSTRANHIAVWADINPDYDPPHLAQTIRHPGAFRCLRNIVGHPYYQLHRR